MADTHTRQAKRTPVTLKIKFKSQTLDQFIERYSVDVSHGGIFIRTKDPLAVGTQMRFEFQLKDATPLIRGEGTVVWTREHDPSRTGVAPGMGVRFDRLIENSQEVLDKILAKKTAKQRGPGFNEVPTKVAPSPLVAGLSKKAEPNFGKLAPPRQSFSDERTDATPLPSPMPFHSDAEDFPEEAFEEATKVASLDALAARSAREEAEDEDLFGAADALVGARGDPALDDEDSDVVSSARDELAARRAAKQAAVENAAAEKVAAEKAAAEKAAAEKAAAEAKAAEQRAAEEKAAEEKAAQDRKVANARALEKKAAAAAAVPISSAKSAGKDQTDRAGDEVVAPAPRSGGGMMGIAAAAVVLVAALAFGGWWMFLRDDGKQPEQASNETPPGAAAAGTPPEPVPAEPPVTAPKPTPKETYETTVETKPAGAMAELVGTDQKKPTPATFELEKGRSYKVRISHPGFVSKQVALREGAPKQKTVALAAMKKVLRIEADPDGAVVYVLGKVYPTPTDIEVTHAIAKRKRLALAFRKRGHKKKNMWVKVTADQFNEDGDALVQSVSATLAPLAMATRPAAPKQPRRAAPKADAAAKPKPDPAAKKPDSEAGKPKPDPEAKKPKPEPKPKPAAKPEPKPKPKATEPKPEPKPKPKPKVPAGPKPSWAE